jgi:YegS/Rv2252/BmrU family lipid kinase
MSKDRSPDEVIILNPNSGSGRHNEEVHHRATQLGYSVTQTRQSGEAIELARVAANNDASTIVAAGGDGTVNEVIQGIAHANAFDAVTVGIIPIGTGNNFATNVGISGLDAAFTALREGERRQVDLGHANGRVFINSCIAGLTAKSSSETSADMKRRFGELAYVVTTLRSASDFEPLRVTLDLNDGTGRSWQGEAICVLIGNGRRFLANRGDQGNIEDGLRDVSVTEEVSTSDPWSAAILEDSLGKEQPHVFRKKTASLSVQVRNQESVHFSFDGEIEKRRQLSVDVRPKTLSLIVGETYRPVPDG